MFQRSQWYQSLRHQLREGNKTAADLDAKALALLFQVELGLYLLEILNLKDDPISVLPAVLSGIPFPALANKMTDKNRMSIAIARILLTAYSSQTGWDEALNSYAKLPDELCAYRIDANIPIEEQLVIACRRNGSYDNARRRVYENTLSNRPDWADNKRRYAQEGVVRFSVYTYNSSGRQERSVTLERQHVRGVSEPTVLPFRPARESIQIPFYELEQVAQYMDERLREQERDPQWNQRLHRYVHYHAYEKGLLSEQANVAPFHIEGFTHLVGMVGSGKSTLMKLIAAHCALQNPSRKVAIVLNDVMSVLDTVDELNSILTTDPDRPVAIPLIGRTTRHEQLKRLYARNGKPSESGERALNTACPLFGLLPDDQLTTLAGIPEPGREPCEQLEQGDSEKKHLCPLFHQCPSQQVWRDLPTASILVTTAGAMTKSSIPTQVDRRRLKYGEYLYTHCDLVIFDECDVAMEWFDNEFATLLELWGKENALFNRADPVTSLALTAGMNRNEARWVRAERRSAETIENLINQLSSGDGAKALQRWVGERYFTAFHLFRRIAMRLLGEWDFTPHDQISIEKASQLSTLVDWFNVTLEGDPLTIRRRSERPEAVHQLIDMLRQLLDGGSDVILDDCEVWLRNHIPNIEQNLLELNSALREKSKKYPLESVQTLAQKLALALNLSMLDRNLRTVFYEWYNQPDNVDDEIGGQPFRPASATLSDVLPIPPIGRIFGTYYIQEKEKDKKGGLLSRFEYSNIGRHYLLHFHELLSDLGMCGPHVLALSGTSWLEGSSQWHIPNAPCGVLQAPKQERNCIRDESEFAFIPQRDASGNLIYVSGGGDLLASVRQLAMALAKSGQIEKELSDLARLNDNQPDLWADRKRILLLVNSYPQAKAVAQQLAAYLRDREGIFYLTRPGQADDELYGFCQAMQRGDAEQFAFTEGKILVAPIGAIGRAYNILNREKAHAAFGAIYFMVRPMPHPYDIQGLASELNAYALASCADKTFFAWKHARLHNQVKTFRGAAHAYWQRAELRHGYSALTPSERRDLAATTFGRLVQAIGRLVRGGVPFHAYFVDASWAPKSAEVPRGTRKSELDSGRDSLLTEIVKLFESYDESEVGRSLYEPFSGLLDIVDFHPKRKDA